MLSVMSAPDYPIELEQWWLDEARALSGVSGLESCIASFETEAGRLSDAFTTDRTPALANYAQDDRLLLAYGLFFFPQTFVRNRLVLREWVGRHGMPARRLRILDLGCGPGSATFAALCQFAVAPAVEAFALDRSSKCLARMQQLFAARRGLWPNAALHTIEGDLLNHALPDSGGWDLICSSFALNEVAANDPDILRWIRRLLARLNPNGALMLLEPAGSETSTRLERLRDELARSGSVRILGPCLHHHPCPLLGSARWCHEVRRWRIPRTVQLLNRRLFRTVEDVKFSFLLLAPGAPASDRKENLFRMIAPLARPKGKLATIGCNTDGQAIHYDVLTRGLDGPGKSLLSGLERGDIVAAQNGRHLADEKTIRAERLDVRFTPRAD